MKFNNTTMFPISIWDIEKEKRLEYLNTIIKELDKDPDNITENQIIKVIREISIYYYFDNQAKKDSYLFDTILDKYDYILSEDKKLEALLSLNFPPVFRKYALKYYQLFEKQLKRTVFVDLFFESETTDIFEIQENLNYKFGKKYYHASNNPLNTLDDSVYEFYKLFNHVINFYIQDEMQNEYLPIFNKMTPQQLINIFIDNNHLSNKAQQYILELMLTKNISEEKLIQDLSDDKKEKFIYKLIQCLQTEEDLNKHFKIILKRLSKYLEVIQNDLKEFGDSHNMPTTISDMSFLQSLNQLKKMSKTTRKTTAIYLKCFQIFLETFLKNFKEEITGEELLIIEALFQRVIEGDDILEILQINNKKTLYHYYKTKELIIKIPYLSLEQVKEYNAKQYLQLQRYRIMKDTESHLSSSKRIIDLETFIIFGYDYFKNNYDLLTNPNIILYLVPKIRDKDFRYIEKLKKVLSEITDHQLFMEAQGINLFIYVFDYLYQMNYSKITAQQIMKNIESYNYILLPNNTHLTENLERLNLVSKGDPLVEKIEGIKLYDIYRFRLHSSIPDISGQLEDCFYQMVDMHDPNIISNGIGEYVYPNQTFAPSCLTPNGKAATCLFHGATNPNGRFFKVTFQNQIVAYSWVWRSGDILCFDNIEVTKKLLEIPNHDKIISEIYLEVAKRIMELTQNEENKGIKLVTLGKNDNDYPNSYLEQLPKVNNYTNQLYHPNNPEKLYLKDSESTQIILTGEYNDELKTEDVKPEYIYKRKDVYCFQDYENEQLSYKINAIYFDYCLSNNIKYFPLDIAQYITGFINEDWFVGIREDGTKEFYSCGDDIRRFKEAERYIPKFTQEERKFTFSIMKSQADQLLYLSNVHNYTLSQPTSEDEWQNMLKQKQILLPEEYLHGTNNLYNFGKILLENEITSAKYGNHQGGSGTNGEHYICVAQVGDRGAASAYILPSIILSKDIFAFDANSIIFPSSVLEGFRNTTYPIRSCGVNNEYQVYKSISLEKAKGILVKPELEIIGQIIYLQEFSNNTLPLIDAKTQRLIDKEEVKKYVKLK